jgi:4-amino-4-deoxy-L-arabinose transferase-like glycosyltransferase
MVAGLLLLGIAVRLGRWLLCFPVWGDEAFICLNVLDRDYAALAGRLRFDQVAPVLFLWAERAARLLFGTSELALRLMPLLAGVAGLLLFARLAFRCLPPRAAAVAAGVLAVAYYPVRHSCEAKPYAFDLLASVLLLTLAVEWLRNPRRRLPLVLLVLAVPLALAGSYPAAFTAGAVSLALLPEVRRQGGRAAWLYAGYNLLMLATFTGLYALAGSGQFASMGGSHNTYWEEWFPPSNPLALLRWLVSVHAGNMLAYPIGGRDGGSTLTLLLVIVGAVRLARSRRDALLALCLVPFGLTFVAAALGRYPYGGSARVAQHLAPAVCLLCGAGVAALVGRRPRAVLAVCGLLVLVGAGGLVRDLQRPYKTEGDRRAREIVAEVMRQAGPDGLVVVLDAPERLHPTFEWYLRQQPVAWDGQIDWERLRTASARPR